MFKLFHIQLLLIKQCSKKEVLDCHVGLQDTRLFYPNLFKLKKKLAGLLNDAAETPELCLSCIL